MKEEFKQLLIELLSLEVEIKAEYEKQGIPFTLPVVEDQLMKNIKAE